MGIGSSMPAKRDLEWAVSSNDDAPGFPKEVRVQLAYAFVRAPEGKLHPDAWPLKGFCDSSVIEVEWIRMETLFGASIPPGFPAPYMCSIAIKKNSKRGVQALK